MSAWRSNLAVKRCDVIVREDAKRPLTYMHDRFTRVSYVVGVGTCDVYYTSENVERDHAYRNPFFYV